MANDYADHKLSIGESFVLETVSIARVRDTVLATFTGGLCCRLTLTVLAFHFEHWVIGRNYFLGIWDK